MKYVRALIRAFDVVFRPEVARSRRARRARLDRLLVYGLSGGAVGTGQTYDFSTSVEKDFEPFIYLLPPTDVPLLGTYNEVKAVPGDMRGGSVFGSVPATEKKVEWQEYDINTPHTLLNGAVLTADTFITVDDNQRERFTTGDIVIIGNEFTPFGDEYLRITGYGTTAHTLTVTRGFGDSSGASHVDNAVVKGTGNALVEGSAAENFRFKDRTGLHNFTQIFGPYKVLLSETQQVIQQYGVPSEMALQMDVILRAMNIHVEQAAIYGQREEDTTNAWRTMGGLIFYIVTNVDGTTTDLTYSKILDGAQDAYDNGGVCDLFITNPTQKRKISGFDSSIIRLLRTDERRGQIVGEIFGDFGSLEILLNRHVRVEDSFGLPKENVDWAALRPLKWVPLAKTADADEGHFVCEKSMRVRMEKRMFRFHTLAA